ncbi:hypothetical protein Q7C36_002336 [Tachysurus vachellii]|uniref:Uncharacterized protein n=1 Tax=Tachysurus vachellii TaxID=175792 RepID=A0AA88NXD2_TACVA|nr:hypothetical protein Q7C36_002336 [Tachysurus vachellii]
MFIIFVLQPRNIFLQEHECHSSHTTGVSTFVYAYPEQVQCSHYDSKICTVLGDRVKLFQPFGTEMECVQTLGGLRGGNFLEDLNAPV